MQTFTVSLQEEDTLQEIKVNSLTEEDYAKATEGGTRHLFELDTNVGFFVFFDSEDKDRNESFLVLHYEENQEEPTACYGFELKDFYQFTALYLNDLAYVDEMNEDVDDEEYGPIHHLAHLLFHIVEEGKKL